MKIDEERLEKIVRFCEKKIFNVHSVVFCINCMNPVNLETYQSYDLTKEEQNYLRTKYNFTFTNCVKCALNEDYQ